MKKKKVAFFSRVSTDLQHSSMENQEKIFQQWLERNPDCVFYKLYEDEGISGSKGYKRVNWLQMLEDGKDGLYDVVVAKSFSRFGRNQTETLQAIKELRLKGIRCVFLEDSLDSEKDMSKFGLFAWLAEQEAQKSSERIKMVWDSFNQQGKVHVTLAPYGYFYDKEIKNFIVNEIEANTVRRIFNLYLEGYGFNNIALTLTNEGVPTKRGGKWAGATVRGILTNEFYIGTLVQGKTRTLDATMKESIKIDEAEWYKHQDNHEAIIELEVFEKVNQQIQERSVKAKNYYTKEHSNKKIKYSNSKSRISNRSLFSNLLVCGECKSTMTIKRKKKDDYKPFYQCIEYDKHSLKCGHSSNRANESFLVEIVKDELTSLSSNNFERLKAIITSKKESKNNIKLQKELDAIERKIDEQIQLANNLLLLYTQGKITELQYGLQNESLNKALNSFMERKKNLIEQIQQDTTKEQTEAIYVGIERILNKPVEEWNNSNLKEVIDSIVIYTDKTIKVNIKYFN